MDASVIGSINRSIIRATFPDDVSWHTTQATLTQEEEGAIVTVIVVVVGVVVTIVILFSMGIFIDCRHQKKNVTKKKRLRLKMPGLSRLRELDEDGKSLASGMCPNGDSVLSTTTVTRDEIV